jgi:hypothetical protein
MMPVVLKVGLVRTVTFTDAVLADLSDTVNAYTADPARGEDRLLNLWIEHDGSAFYAWLVYTAE